MGKAVRAIVGVVLTVVGFVTGNPMLIVQGASMTFSALTQKDPKKATTTAAAENRLSKRLEPETFRKIIFGETAAGLDMRYWEVWGTNAMNYDEVLANASHRITSFEALYLNDELAIPAGSNAGTGKFAGIFSRNTCLEGVSGVRSVLAGAGVKWKATSSMTGVAHMSLQYVYSQEKWPQNIPSRYTQVVKGAPVYDPRRDVSLGGTHVITNQATWEYLPLDSNGKPIGRNNALQVLWYLIGWKIAGKLVAGRGVDPSDLNLDAFIIAANDCETMGWYSDCILSTGDSHSTNEGVLSSASGGQLLDTGGRYSYRVAVDDTANVAAYLTDDHIVGSIQWVPKRKMSEQFNEIAGTFVDPSPTALYQPRAFPMVWDQAYYDADGFKRRKTLALGAVQDAGQAQKLARIELNRGRLQGTFTATFNYAALQVENWSLVRLTFSRYGWVNKLFRVTEQAISPLGGIVMTLTEESASVYLGGTVVVLPPPSAGTAYNASQKIAVGVVTTAAYSVIGSNGSTADHMRVLWPSVDGSVKSTQLRYRKTTDAAWTFADGNLVGQTEVLVGPLLSGTAYEFQVRHISINDVPGDWSGAQATAGTDTRHTAGQVFYPAVGALPTVAISTLRPGEAGANVTEGRTAAAFTGQGLLATRSAVDDGYLTGSLAYRVGAHPTYGANYLDANRVLYANSYSLDQLRPGEANANVTEGRTAASIAGQGALATTSTISTDSQLSGSIGLRLEPSPVNANYLNAARSLYSNSFNLDQLRPQEAGANATEGRTAAAIAGQSALATNPDFAGVTGITRPSNNAGTSLVLLPYNAEVTIIGNTATKTGGIGGAWGAGVSSRDKFPGSAYCSFRIGASAQPYMMAGLASDAFAGTYQTVNYSLFVEGPPASSGVHVYQNGAFVVTLAGFNEWSLSDVWSVVYDGVRVQYLQNGAVRYTSSAAAGQVLGFAASQVYIGNFLTDIQVGAGPQVGRVGQNVYDDTGGALVPRMNLLTSLGQAATIAGQGPGATAAGDLVLNNRSDGNAVSIPSPVGGALSQNGVVTGCLKVALPQTWTSSMLRFAIDIYEFGTGQSVTYYVAGYNYASGPGPHDGSWVNCSAQIVGPRDRTMRVRFGHDGAKAALYIGEVGTVWQYPVVRVRDLNLGYINATESLWATGWVISFPITVGTISAEVSVPRAGDAVFGEGVLEQAGGIVATRVAFRTDQGAAASIAGQSLLATNPDFVNVTGATRPANNATVGARAGTNFYRTDGVTVMTQAEVRTNEGVAASVIGQQLIATQVFPTYAGIAAAKAAGLTDGRQFYDSTNSNLLTAVVSGGGATTVAKQFASGVGGTTATSSTYSAVGNVLLELTATLDGGKLDANATWFGTFTLREVNAGGTTSHGPYAFSVTSNGLEFPAGQWGTDGGGVYGKMANGTRTGTVTYYVDVARTSGSFFAAGATINATLKITPIS